MMKMKKIASILFALCVLSFTSVQAQTDTVKLLTGDTLNLDMDASRGSVQWQSSSDASTWTDISGETNATLSVAVNSLPSYYRAVLSEGDCDDFNTPYVTVVTCLGPPTLSTTAISNIGRFSADGGGEVLDDGCAAIQARGVVYATTPNPTISNFSTADGSGMGSFTSNMTNLTAGTTYYVRAYAFNGSFTGYGPELMFTTAAQFAVGDTGPGGGIVYYLDSQGGGWEVATSDQSTSATWGCNGVTFNTSFSEDSSASNTNKIVANSCITSSDAAQICANLTSGGFSDWVLPSRQALSLIHTNVHQAGKGGFNTSDEYWSSSEQFSSQAWHWNFGFGTQLSSFRTQNFRVRAVRKF
jgi:hypothetical protein